MVVTSVEQLNNRYLIIVQQFFYAYTFDSSIKLSELLDKTLAFEPCRNIYHDSMHNNVFIDSKCDVAVQLTVVLDRDLLHDGALAAEECVFGQGCWLCGVGSWDR